MKALPGMVSAGSQVDALPGRLYLNHRGVRTLVVRYGPRGRHY